MQDQTTTTFDTINSIAGFIGSIASVIGLIITLLLLRKIKKIQREFLHTARAPELLTQLVIDKEKLQELLAEIRETHSSSTTYILPPRDDSTIAVLAACRSNLAGLFSKLDGTSKRSVKDLIVSIDDINKKAPKIEDVAVINAKLVGVITEIENELKDRKWIRQ